MILTAIAAMAKNRVIGQNNNLPWHIPEDLKIFRDLTKSKILVMGRKTFESLPKPLPGRFHIVITQQKNYQMPEQFKSVLMNPIDSKNSLFHAVGSLQEAIESAKNKIPPWPEEVCIVGGAEIYRQSLPILDRIILSEIDKEFAGDTYFPQFEEFNFQLRSEIRIVSKTPFSVKTYEK